MRYNDARRVGVKKRTKAWPRQRLIVKNSAELLLCERLTEHNFFGHVFKVAFEFGFSLEGAEKTMANMERKEESVYPMQHAVSSEAMNAAKTTVPRMSLLSLDLVSMRFHRRIFREKMQKGFDYLKTRTKELRRVPDNAVHGTHSSIGKYLTEAREEKRILAYGRREIVVTQTIVVVLVHLFQGDLHQFFDILVGIFITGLLERAKRHPLYTFSLSHPSPSYL